MTQEGRAPEGVADRSAPARSVGSEGAFRLEYYEKFGALLQQQLDAIVARGAEVSRELEVTHAELGAENARVWEETRALREEAEDLRKKVEERRAESAAVAEETERAQSLVMEQLAKIREEIGALTEERDRRRAEVMQAAQKFARERTQLLEKLAPLREEAQRIESERRQRRAEAEALMDEMERVRRERTGLLADVAGLRAESHQLGEERDRRRAESLAILDAAHEEASRILNGVQETTRVVVSRAMDDLQALRPSGFPALTKEAGESTDGPPTGQSIATRLILRPPAEAERLQELRRALESLPDVLGTEPGPSSDDSASIVVTHSLASSLVRHLIGIRLEFRLVTRGEDFLEIEVLDRGALGP